MVPIPRARIHRPPRSRAIALCLGLLLAALGLAGASVHADSYDERRVRSGARLIRTLLAAELGLEQRLGREGDLQVLVYSDGAVDSSPLLALIAASPLGTRRLTSAPMTGLPAENDPAPAVIFLASPLPQAEFIRLRDWSIRHRVILYSPFEGDVERGATAGLSVEARVLPYVNLSTLRASGIQLRPFFMKVAKAHP